MEKERPLKKAYFEGDDLFTREYVVSMTRMDQGFWDAYADAVEMEEKAKK